MPARLKLTVAYDGTAFAGWQSQAHRNTVQDQLEQALKQISGNKVRIHGAGRTDAGVHALAQCAHIDISDRRLSGPDWRRALNAVLPPTIRVFRSTYPPANFHARYSAKGKIYRYRIWCHEILPPHELHRAWHFYRTLDLTAAKAVAALFQGKHDFAGFAANRGKVEEDTIRTIRTVRIRRRGPLLSIEFDGDGFLYKMARLMVGAIVDAGSGKLQVDDVRAALRNGRGLTPRLAAPAEGLYLVRVRY